MDILKIRVYTDEDFDPITRLWCLAREQAFPDFQEKKGRSFDEDCAYFRNVILSENQVWVADLNGLPVGFMAIRGDFIDQLFVHPDWQGRGLGQSLLGHARRLSPDRLRLYTFQTNTRGRVFYEKNGFRALKFGVSSPPENEPDVLYEWKAEVD